MNVSNCLWNEWFSDDFRGRQETFMCLAALLCEQFRRFANGSTKISITSYFMRSFFFSMYSAAVKCCQHYFNSEKTANCSLLVSGKKMRKLLSQLALCRKRLRYHRHAQTPQTNHSQNSSPAEALNLIVDSKSQSVELDNWTIELHVPSRRKKSLQTFCSVILISLLDAI